MVELERGPHPVGVRTAALDDEARPLAIELWYPADAELQGRDVTPRFQDLFEVLPGMRGSRQAALRDATPAPGPWPLAVFSHGFGGHRRQSSFLCTHLASHGFAVLGVDHAGNTLADLARPMMRAMRGQEVDLFVDLETVIEERPRDLQRAVDHAVPLFDLPIDTARFSVVGHSFGGWTALQVAGRDARVAGVVALAPVGGPHPRGDGFERALDLDWPRPVPTAFVVAGRDSMVPVEGTHELFRRVRAPKRWLALPDADHLHFCDRPRELHEMYRTMPMAARAMGATHPLPRFAELCSPEDGFATARAVALAMTAAVTGGDVEASLDEAEAALRERGVSLSPPEEGP